MINILSILLLVFLLIDIYITVKRSEETMETKDNKELIIFNSADLTICIRSIEFLINTAKNSEKELHGDMLKASREIVKQAKKTLKKLKAIDSNNNKIFRDEK